VRVEGARVGIEEELEDFFGLDLIAALEHAIVASAQYVTGLGPGLAGEQQGERIVFHALAPKFVEFADRGGPSGLFAIELERFVEREVGFAIEQGECVLDPLAVTLLVTREHGVGGFDVAGADHVVEAQSIRLKFGDVAGQKITALAIESVDELVHHAGRHGIVDLELAVVVVFEQRADLPRDHALACRGHERPGRQRRGVGREPRGAAHGEQTDRQQGHGKERGGTASGGIHRRWMSCNIRAA